MAVIFSNVNNYGVRHGEGGGLRLLGDSEKNVSIVLVYLKSKTQNIGISARLYA